MVFSVITGFGEISFESPSLLCDLLIKDTLKTLQVLLREVAMLYLHPLMLHNSSDFALNTVSKSFALTST